MYMPLMRVNIPVIWTLRPRFVALRGGYQLVLNKIQSIMRIQEVIRDQKPLRRHLASAILVILSTTSIVPFLHILRIGRNRQNAANHVLFVCILLFFQ